MTSIVSCKCALKLVSFCSFWLHLFQTLLLSLLKRTCLACFFDRAKPLHPPEQLGRYNLDLLEAPQSVPSGSTNPCNRYQQIKYDKINGSLNLLATSCYILIRLDTSWSCNRAAEVLYAWHCELLQKLLRQARALCKFRNNLNMKICKFHEISMTRFANLWRFVKMKNVGNKYKWCNDWHRRSSASSAFQASRSDVNLSW